tara:strand:+ start:38 stop:463 length:426 start_codon:yes stop_codon:yes gene_type:complete
MATREQDSSPAHAEVASNNVSEPLRMPSRKELLLFGIFGLVPIVVLYLFASQAFDDPKGRAFEQERRLLMTSCMEQFGTADQKNRERCREIIDEPLLTCYEGLANPTDGTVADRLALRQCITGREDDLFRLREDAAAPSTP